jgi:predicted nucleic acid-binding Zn ribbon protein
MGAKLIAIETLNDRNRELCKRNSDIEDVLFTYNKEKQDTMEKASIFYKKYSELFNEYNSLIDKISALEDYVASERGAVIEAKIEIRKNNIAIYELMENSKIKTCYVCKSLFEPKNSNTVYCSSNCKKEIALEREARRSREKEKILMEKSEKCTTKAINRRNKEEDVRVSTSSVDCLLEEFGDVE